MQEIVNRFDHLLKSMNFQTRRENEGKCSSLSVFGDAGSVEVEFTEDEIFAIANVGENYHCWFIFPDELKSNARKIRELIEKA